ncbi:FAD-dependent oxidoreductase [Metabacillus iocasae]|uniref:Glycine/D-amino acid oxidase-like deaminating enzyme/nitrite reductase/ring-hydroxylating ferredoxin subunit n=1 Tax=Priestia iocasae TaxID=2291674 RepID=A0ABS2QWM2_9BACI|nr:FAD-dependent oxidoreductase [Metabacillus iocasae]MBM7703855.1 glycine/D-amino acid oxidase-like deaminating enzyme/nitrite reductase/ring-hydroxylating ferredoxin subunit [Metabacillus iocasae]
MTHSNIPQSPEPFWRSNIPLPTFDKLKNDITVDVAIVGGGITGITAAYLLTKEGMKVALLEANELLNGTTGHTTAKLTAQHGLIYDELINHIGKEQAKNYYKANNEALQFVKELIQEKQIDCDFSTEDAYIYTNSEKYVQKLYDEFKAYQKLDIPSELVHEIPFDFPIKKAIVMKEQAQFHPLKYLLALVEEMTHLDGKIFEHTVATDVEKGEQPVVTTRDGAKVYCKHVVAASHFPFYDGNGFYFTRMYAERSYVIGIKATKEYPGGMYLSAEQPTRSLRYTEINGEKLILVGGDSHKTGQGINTMEHYQALQHFAEQTLGIKEYLYRWSAQDLYTLDKVPYIGPITPKKENIYVATGYRKWGMTNGTAAALLLRDLILNRENPYTSLFSPSRFHGDPSIKQFLIQNFDVAGHLIEGKLDVGDKRLQELEVGEGSVVFMKGKRAGAYKDLDGKLHCVDTTCTHLGCEVEWNAGDTTWDCPCHGSRFSYDGQVIEGPANEPLKQVNIEE